MQRSVSLLLCFSRSIGALGALVRRISFPTLLFSVRIIAPMPRETKRKGRELSEDKEGRTCLLIETSRLSGKSGCMSPQRGAL